MHKLYLFALSVLLAITASSAASTGDTRGDNPNPPASYTKYPPGIPTLVPEPIRQLPPGVRYANPECNPFYRPGALIYDPPQTVKFINFTGPPPEPCETYHNTTSVEDRWKRHHYHVVYPNGTAQPVRFPLEIFKELEQSHTPIFSEMTRGQYLVYGSETNKSLDARNHEKRIIVPPKDDRVEVFNTWPFPFNTVGKVESGCTGTLIGPRHVLTAGHCVHSGGASGNWFSNINFTLTFRPSSEGITTRTFAWSQVMSTVGWTENHDPDYDYAVITLGDTTTKFPWMSFGYNTALGKGWIININGFPRDEPINTMWHSDGTIVDATNEHLDYNADTNPGSSGSGVYAYWSNTNTRIIYGIHAYGFTPKVPTFNRATRINKVRFDLICTRTGTC